jgi:hypothetical protein
LRKHLQNVVKHRLQTDINQSFDLETSALNNCDTNPLNAVRDFLKYVEKIARSIKVVESMSIALEYNEVFALFEMNYIKMCFFEENGVADRVCLIVFFFLIIVLDYLSYLS